MKIKSANGVVGCLLRVHDIQNKYVFRVYDQLGGFIDYDIDHSDLVVKIIDEDSAFYETDNGDFILDHSPETLGLSTKNENLS